MRVSILLLSLLHCALCGASKSFINSYDSCYSVSIDETKYILEDSIHNQTVLSIKNISDANIWFLLEADTSKTDREILRYRVLSPKPFHGMPLIKLFSEEITWIDDFTPEIYSYLIKIIAPGKSFNIVLLSSKSENIDDVIGTMRVMSSSTLDNAFTGLSSIEPDTKPTYQSDFLTIPIELINNDSKKYTDQ